MALHSAPRRPPLAAPPTRKTLPQKLRREFARVSLQVRTFAWRPLAITTRNEFLFVLGHMRSGSTLLSHLLCNSPDIIGYGETHNNYRRRTDLAKLLTSVRACTGKNPFKYRFVLDKIVGEQHILNASVLNDPRTRYIFLLREPQATIASIVAMRRQWHDETPEQLLAFASSYYQFRLSQLVAFAETIDNPRRCLLVTHRQMLDETQAAFRAFESFLQLSAPLREDYDVTPTTGTPGVGDTSVNIKLGKISRSLPRKHVDMSPELVAHVQSCFETSLNKLRQIVPAFGSESRGDNLCAA
jgi:Sulfotransferase family